MKLGVGYDLPVMFQRISSAFTLHDDSAQQSRGLGVTARGPTKMSFKDDSHRFRRRKRRCQRSRREADVSDKTAHAFLLSKILFLVAVLRLADGFNPALQLSAPARRRTAGQRYGEGIGVCAAGEWGYARVRPFPSAERRKRTLVVNMGANKSSPKAAINGYGEKNEGWMRTRRGSWAASRKEAEGSNTEAELVGDEKENVVAATPPQVGIAGEATVEAMEEAAKRSVPLKVMVFIDGTWLYYSFFGRGSRCHVSAKLGSGWTAEYRVKWEMLPVIISRAVHAQLAKNGQSSRLVEVVRNVVFSSARKDTDKWSLRFQMFENMRDHNFEVHLATTMGVQEKCIDIALAVEMMHYATIPDSYDVGVLVTGDKDFMPAMSRTRQKGRRVCLCSMHNSCNHDILKSDAHVMDFAPVWIDDYLEDMLEYAPYAPAEARARGAIRVDQEALCEIIVDAIKHQGGTINSRALGRHLQKTVFRGKESMPALSFIKNHWRTLTNFLLDQADTFQLGKGEPVPGDPLIRQFTVSLVDEQNSMKSVKLGQVADDSPSDGSEDDPDFDNGDVEDDGAWEGNGGVNEFSDGEEGKEAMTEESLTSKTVPELKELLKERGLPVSGRKAVLVERLLVAATEDDHKSALEAYTPRATDEPQRQSSSAGEDSSSGHGVSSARTGFDATSDGRQKMRVSLVRMLADVLDANEAATGRAGMTTRDVGRALTSLDAPDGSDRTALASLKEYFPSLMSFLRSNPNSFRVETIRDDPALMVFKVDSGRGGEARGSVGATSGYGVRNRRGSDGGDDERSSGDERRRRAVNRTIATGSTGG